MLADPLSDTPIRVSLEQLRPYDYNPRTLRNPLHDQLKASIRERGLDQPPTITRRPGETTTLFAMAATPAWPSSTSSSGKPPTSRAAAWGEIRRLAGALVMAAGIPEAVIPTDYGLGFTWRPKPPRTGRLRIPVRGGWKTGKNMHEAQGFSLYSTHSSSLAAFN